VTTQGEVVRRCPVCGVASEQGKPDRHLMTCVLRLFEPYPGPSKTDCDHKWNYEKDRCLLCNETWERLYG